MQVQLDNGSIQLLHSDEPNVRVELTGQGSKQSNAELHVEEKDGSLSIEVHKTKRTMFNLFNGVNNLRLTVHVPENAVDAILAEIDNGSLTAKQLQVNQFKAESDNGDILLDHVSGLLTAGAVNGKITVHTENLDRNMDMSADNGSIYIESEREPANVRFDARAENGKVQLFEDQDLPSVFGSGDHLIKLRTDNGNITIEQK